MSYKPELLGTKSRGHKASGVPVWGRQGTIRGQRADLPVADLAQDLTPASEDL